MVTPLYEMSHPIPFGPMVIADFFLVALSAGLLYISLLGSVFGLNKYESLAKPTAIMALATVLAGPVALLLDLGHPLRFLNLYLHFNVTSMMSWGTYILTIYIILLLVYTLLLDKIVKFGRVIGIMTGVFALALGSYTGLLLVEATGRFMWNSALIPVLFIFTGFLAAWGLVAMASIWFPKIVKIKEDFVQTSRTFISGLLIGQIVLISLYLIGLGMNGDAGMAAFKHLFTERQVMFVWVQLVGATLLPLILVTVVKNKHAVAFAGLLSFLGVLALRFNIVLAGQEIPQTGNLLNQLSGHVFDWVVFGLAFAAAIILITVLPIIFNLFEKRIVKIEQHKISNENLNM